jgi:hypothetical protein
LLGSIILLIAGAALSPVAQELWNKCFPSLDSKYLEQLASEKPSFDFYVNGFKIPTNCLVPVLKFGQFTTFSNATNFVVHIPESGEVNIGVANVGKAAADKPLINFIGKPQISVA